MYAVTKDDHQDVRKLRDMTIATIHLWLEEHIESEADFDWLPQVVEAMSDLVIELAMQLISFQDPICGTCDFKVLYFMVPY